MTITLEFLRARASRALCGLVWLHVPLVAVMAWALGVPLLVPLAMTALMAGITLALVLRQPQAAATHIVLAITLGMQIALMVGLMRGHAWQSDMHMYFFAGLAMLAALCSWPAILAFVGFVAIHHLALNFLMSDLVFGGGADLARAMLHAVILLTEGVALGAMTYLLERMFRAQSEAVDLADGARATAEQLLSSRSDVQAQQARFLDRLISGITDLAAGDYGREIAKDAFPPEYESVAHALNLLSRRLRSTVTTVSQAARGVQNSGASLVSTAQALEASSAEQVALLDRARSAFGALGQGIGTTITLAAQADTAMKENRVEVDRGTALLGEVVEAMGLIEQSTGQIRQIVEVMDNIAFQTNLLALNAGVEAARAGETGRGFAVVASEVRALAQRAAESAREIRGLIDQGQGNVELGTRKVDLTSQALESLIASALRAGGFVSEITGLIRNQGQGLTDLQGEVTSLETQARHNANLAARISSAGDELRQHSSALAQGMGELEGAEAHPARRVA